MYTFRTNEAGFGNLLIKLASTNHECRKIHENIVSKYELSNCITFNRYTIVTDDCDHPPSDRVSIGDQSNHLIQSIVSPTTFMSDMINTYTHLVKDVVAGIHIRRGSFSNDSTASLVHATDPWAFHSSDTTVSKFENIIESLNGKVYVASDSKSIKDRMKAKFGDKVKMLECEFALTAQTTLPHQTPENYHKVYLEWFLLSMCPMLYITGGSKDFVGFSTFSYTAGVYGNKPMLPIFNEEKSRLNED